MKTKKTEKKTVGKGTNKAVAEMMRMRNPFKENKLIGTLFSIGCQKGKRSLKEILLEHVHQPIWDKVMKVTAGGRKVHLSMKDKLQRAYWQYTIISSTGHPTNHGRARSIESGRGENKQVRFQAVA